MWTVLPMTYHMNDCENEADNVMQDCLTNTLACSYHNCCLQLLLFLYWQCNISLSVMMMITMTVMRMEATLIDDVKG